MTTIVRRGTGRAAASARTVKAAQRTPLPEKSTAKVARRGSGDSVKLSTSGPAAQKAERFRGALEPYGWTVKTKTTGGRTAAQAARGTVTVKLVWDAAGRYIYGASLYNAAGRMRKLRNLSEAIRLCAVEVK